MRNIEYKNKKCQNKKYKNNIRITRIPSNDMWNFIVFKSSM